MTKKKETKQPRDNNGKFTKIPCIALHGKDGSTAFFTSVGEMEKFTSGEGIKVKPHNQDAPKNPDCDPATKGYVKCLLRKTREHTHVLRFSGLPSGLGLIMGVGLSCVCIMDRFSNTHGTFFNQYAGLIFTFTAIMGCMFYEFINLKSEEVETPLPTELKRYTPPTCEKKEECE